MSQTSKPGAITKSVVIGCSVEAAFRAWTERIDLWWPKGHSRSGDPLTSVVLEGFVGGRLYERTPTGAVHEWGRVTAWAPPHHLTYHWFLGSGPQAPTRVDVRFYAEASDRTRVEVLHQGPELLGERWSHASAIFDTAWEHVLAAYAAAPQPNE